MLEKQSSKVRKITNSQRFERTIIKLKKQDAALFNQLVSKMEKIVNAPHIGKPLRYALKNQRRIHVGSFVLVYEFNDSELRFLDFDHHDRVYKKH